MNPAPLFLKLPIERRALAFAQAATQRGLDAAILEKDFWVCWLLGMLFSLPEIGPHLVFKGGTSLSKVFGVIDRFSEDVDLSVSPALVGADAQAFEALTSRTQRDVAMAELRALSCQKVRHFIAPLLEAEILRELGKPRRQASWLSFEIDASGSPILQFYYPATQTRGLNYLSRTVKLELGSLTDQQPAAHHNVRPWVADEIPAAFTDWRCEVTALEIARTFWEKATILHAEYYRPADQAMPDRYARHYSDMARQLGHPDGAAFLADDALCTRVAVWKSRLFARSWARYDLARKGSFRLVPLAARQPALTHDYVRMRPMFLHEPPSFDKVVQSLAEAERSVNAI